MAKVLSLLVTEIPDENGAPGAMVMITANAAGKYDLKNMVVVSDPAIAAFFQTRLAAIPDSPLVLNDSVEPSEDDEQPDGEPPAEDDDDDDETPA